MLGCAPALISSSAASWFPRAAAPCSGVGLVGWGHCPWTAPPRAFSHHLRNKQNLPSSPVVLAHHVWLSALQKIQPVGLYQTRRCYWWCRPTQVLGVSCICISLSAVLCKHVLLALLDSAHTQGIASCSCDTTDVTNRCDTPDAA